MLVFLIGYLFFELNHAWLFAQACFLILILNLIVFAARRVPHRSKDLPSPFLLMFFGFVHALLGTAFLLVSHFGKSNFYLFVVGRQMIQLGLLLCMVMGITGKLAPFLLGYTDNPEKPALTSNGIGNERLVHGCVGAAVLGSFFLDPFAPRVAAAIRAVVVTAHLLAFAKIARPLLKKTTVMFLFHVSCWMVPLGLWLAFLFPTLRIAVLHFVFIGGFSLMIFSFGSLIVLSHSMKAALVNGRLIFLRFVGSFVVAAAAFRFLAEIFPSKYLTLIHTSSGLWVVAAFVWGASLSPALFGRTS